MSTADQSRTPRPFRRTGLGGFTFPRRIHSCNVTRWMPTAFAALIVMRPEAMATSVVYIITRIFSSCVPCAFPFFVPSGVWKPAAWFPPRRARCGSTEIRCAGQYYATTFASECLEIRRSPPLAPAAGPGGNRSRRRCPNRPGSPPVVLAPDYTAFTVAVRRHAVTSLMTFSYSAVRARST